jgi:hypothetical protein
MGDLEADIAEILSVGADRITIKLGPLVRVNGGGRGYNNTALIHAPSIDFDDFVVEDNLQSTAALLYKLLQYKTNYTADRPDEVIRSLVNMPRSGASLESVANGRVVLPGQKEFDVLLWTLCGTALLAVVAGLGYLFYKRR